VKQSLQDKKWKKLEAKSIMVIKMDMTITTSIINNINIKMKMRNKMIIMLRMKIMKMKKNKIQKMSPITMKLLETHLKENGGTQKMKN
jgi:rubrerythrin